MRKFFRLVWRILTFPFRLVVNILRFFGRSLRALASKLHIFTHDEPEDRPFTESVATVIKDPETALEHINSLRSHLLRAVIALAITTATSFAYTPQLVEFLARPIGGLESLTAIEVTEPLSVYMRVALLSGFVFALPYIAFEVWLFAAPGLLLRTRFKALLAIPLVVIFFLGGMAFAYFVMLDPALEVLLNVLNMSTQVRPDSYLRFATGLLFWLGVFFEFPLLVYLLAALRIVRAKVLAEQWRLAIVIISVIAAAITPTVDPVNMSLVMGPMIILYFLSIGMAFVAQRGARPKAQAPAKPSA